MRRPRVTLICCTWRSVLFHGVCWVSQHHCWISIFPLVIWICVSCAYVLGIIIKCMPINPVVHVIACIWNYSLDSGILMVFNSLKNFPCFLLCIQSEPKHSHFEINQKLNTLILRPTSLMCSAAQLVLISWNRDSQFRGLGNYKKRCLRLRKGSHFNCRL